MGEAIGTQFFASDALLLGRVTYQGFAAAWPSRTTDEDEFADRINSMPKFVVSTTLEAPLEWNNSSLIKGNVAEETTKLKQQPGAGILINGSATLVQSLLQDDLIDEIGLLIHPVVVGSGRRLFKDGGDQKGLKLVDSRLFSTGVVYLTYQSAGRVRGHRAPAASRRSESQTTRGEEYARGVSAVVDAAPPDSTVRSRRKQGLSH